MTGEFAHEALSRLRHRVQRALDNRRSRAELETCPPSELHRIAQDVGLSDADLQTLDCSHPGPRELMPRRLEQLGLDPAYLKQARGATYRDMERVCASCKTWRRCTHDLAKGNVQAGMRSYCLNAPTIDALMVERPGTPGS